MDALLQYRCPTLQEPSLLVGVIDVICVPGLTRLVTRYFERRSACRAKGFIFGELVGHLVYLMGH